MTVEQARKEIAQILAQLEKDTGQLVKDLSVCGIDVTSLDSNGPLHKMNVSIELERLPGHEWL